MSRITKSKKVKVDLALQGGGSHGAFTWGVLDRLLEETWIEINGVSGTSAGAMNAIGLVQGLAQDGPDDVRTLLRTFWTRVSKAGAFSPLQRTMMDRMMSGWRLDNSPIYAWTEVFSAFFSPYDFNPFASIRFITSWKTHSIFKLSTPVQRPSFFNQQPMFAAAV